MLPDPGCAIMRGAPSKGGVSQNTYVSGHLLYSRGLKLERRKIDIYTTRETARGLLWGIPIYAVSSAGELLQPGERIFFCVHEAKAHVGLFSTKRWVLQIKLAETPDALVKVGRVVELRTKNPSVNIWKTPPNVGDGESRPFWNSVLGILEQNGCRRDG